MTLEKILHPWASQGDIESDQTLTNTKRDTGWVGGDRPAAERFNALQNETDILLNRIVEESPPTYDMTVTAAHIKDMLSTGRWFYSWAQTHDGPNIFNDGVAAPEAYIDTCVYFDSNSNPRILALDQASNVIDDFDARASNPGLEPTGTSSGTLTDDLPSGGGEVWVATSMCTDGTSVYVTFRDTGATPDEYHIQAWDISSWDVKVAWPSTGRALPATGNPLNADTRPCTVIDASSTYLAVAQSATVITAATSNAISIVAKYNGVISDSGAGDAPTTGSCQPCGTLCSDGLNIFFGVAHPTTNTYICTATIADPDVGVGGGAGYPLTHTGSYKNYLVACGGKLIVSVFFQTSTPAANDIVIRTHNSDSSDLDIIYRGQSSYTTPLMSDDYLLHYPRAVCFDGLNLWIYGANHLANSDHLIGTTCLVKIDVAKFVQYNAVQLRQLPDIVSGTFVVNGIATKSWSNDHAYSSLTFDGRDLFTVFDPAASQPYSGELYRFPRAVLRQ